VTTQATNTHATSVTTSATAGAGYLKRGAYAVPKPEGEAHRLLMEARDLMTVALDAARANGDSQRSAELVGRASDRIGQALYFLRQVLRQR